MVVIVLKLVCSGRVLQPARARARGSRESVDCECCLCSAPREPDGCVCVCVCLQEQLARVKRLALFHMTAATLDVLRFM